MTTPLFWLLVAWCACGVASGCLLGLEWLSGLNTAGFSRMSMLLPSAGLAASAPVLWAMRGESELGKFYGQLAWAFALGGAAWSRVGWVGRWPGPWIDSVDLILGPLCAVATILAVVSMLRVAAASRALRVKVMSIVMLGSVVSIGLFCAWDVLAPITDLTPITAATIALLTFGGATSSALAAAFFFPRIPT